MAFKNDTFASSYAADPAAHFKTLTKRQFPDVMPHQKEILEAYAQNLEQSSDVALQLPTGSGKTLVGLLIADWKRIKNGGRVVYLCPTKQLVRQTVKQARENYGIDVVDLSGEKASFNPQDEAAYKTGSQVAISTYSGLFNTHPFFDDPDLIIVDDAHAAENYIASMWSLDIAANTPLHTALTEFLRSHIDAQSHSRLSGDWSGPSDTNWVEKLPSPIVDSLSQDLVQIIDAHSDYSVNKSLYFTWSLLRDHLDACQVFLASRQILIRPLIPPTSTHRAFNNASQRIFMSATLGEGGDLERLTGRRQIARLPAPAGFQSAGVGRRFFVFPTLSLTGDETDTLLDDMQKVAGRSVILTPSSQQAIQHRDHIEKKLPGFTIFDKDDIETDKTPFVSTSQAIAVLANRYDGIDFPGDECRLLCVDGLPKAMNAQEMFIMSKMGATALYNERIQTRVLQAVGRCTRALQDRSAVFVTGTELVDFLADKRRWTHFYPELQAELQFGVDQSTSVKTTDVLDNFKMFMANNAGWIAADASIRTAVSKFRKTPFPAMGDLESVVKYEVVYQEALWNKDYNGASAAARQVLSGLIHSDLRGYRALWHYLAGAAELRLMAKPNDARAASAREQFSKAKGAAPSVSWLHSLSRIVDDAEPDASAVASEETSRQVEAVEALFLTLGTATNHKFEKLAAEIQAGIDKPGQFEGAQVKLGTLLGLTAGNDESDAAPDPWWLGVKTGIVFEDHAGGTVTTIFGATKARQASSHPKWISKNIPGTDQMTIYPILVTPCSKAKYGADPHLDDVYFWRLEDFKAWSTRALHVMRELKSSFPGEGDLFWRTEAADRLEAEGLTVAKIIDALPFASQAMEIVP